MHCTQKADLRSEAPSHTEYDRRMMITAINISPLKTNGFQFLWQWPASNFQAEFSGEVLCAVHLRKSDEKDSYKAQRYMPADAHNQ